jgi:hypothetical protein
MWLAGGLAAIAVAVVALTACGVTEVLPSYPVAPIVSDPGAGKTMADRLYREVEPVVGELFDPPNPNEPIVWTLSDRLLSARKKRPEWSVRELRDPDAATVMKYGCQDLSVLVIEISPRPGEHLPPPGPDTGTEVTAVRMIRP